MSNNEDTQGRLNFCRSCGRIVYENIKTKRIGCRNTKCRFYLRGSKNLDEKSLRPFRS